MAKEKNLTAVTSVAAADFARVVTSAGASVKATFANVAKYIIETYNGSTVAGSAQSVKSALDSLNSKTTGSATGVSGSATDLVVRQYGKVVVINGYVNSASLTSGTPSHIATFSGVSLPTEGIRTLCGVAAAAYQHPTDVAYLYIGTDGKITITSTINGSRSVYFTASYIV